MKKYLNWRRNDAKKVHFSQKKTIIMQIHVCTAGMAEELGYVKFSSLHIYIYIYKPYMVFASRNYPSPPAATSTKMKRILHTDQ